MLAVAYITSFHISFHSRHKAKPPIQQGEEVKTSYWERQKYLGTVTQPTAEVFNSSKYPFD